MRDLTLVDDDDPVVTPSKAFYELDLAARVQMLEEGDLVRVLAERREDVAAVERVAAGLASR